MLGWLLHGASRKGWLDKSVALWTLRLIIIDHLTLILRVRMHLPVLWKVVVSPVKDWELPFIKRQC